MIQLSLEEAKKYLLIDKHQLDIECSQQPELFYRIGEQNAIAISKKDAAKEEIASIDAELDAYYRNVLGKAGKFTETQVKQKIQLDLRHKKVLENYIALKLESDKWGSLRDAFMQRSTMIKHLCELHSMSYYNGDGSHITEESLNQKENYDSVREKIKASRLKNGKK